MSKIFKNMVPYWKTVFVILALLLIQAMCDLALPSYTSDIIDVGIQKSGVEHVVPQAVTAEEFETAQLTMTEDEGRLWRNLYEKEGEVYKLTESAQKHWDEMDEKLVLPLILNYQMSAMEESAFKSYAASQSGMDKAKIDAMSMEELGRMLGVSLTPFEQQKEDTPRSAWMSVRYSRQCAMQAGCRRTQFFRCGKTCKRPSTRWEAPWSDPWASPTQLPAIRQPGWMSMRYRLLICGQPV